MGVVIRIAVVCLVYLGLPPGAVGDTVEKWLTVGVKNLQPRPEKPARPSVVANESWPGPTMYARDGDIIKVHVFNNQSIPITLHWHGISQIDSPWYDGVPGITQCAIAKGATYTYIFQVRGQWGTFWYHSHVPQLRNTLNGAFIVSPPPGNADPLSDPIEDEFVMMGGDWYQMSPTQLNATISSPPFPSYPLPDALHLNGRISIANLQYFTVKARRWYRLRMINAAMYASYNIRIQAHTMYLFETEGGYLAKRQISSLDVYPGQSYSVLLYTNQKPTNYWIVLWPRYDAAKVVSLRAQAVLHYSAAVVPMAPPNSGFPPAPSSTLQSNSLGPLAQTAMRSPYVIQELHNNQVDKLIILELNLNTNTKTGQQYYSFNNNSLTGASDNTPFLLADYQGRSVYGTLPSLPPQNLGTQKDGPTKLGPAVIPVDYGDWVQIVFQNHVPPGGLHSYHMHGHNYYVVAQGTGTFNRNNWKNYAYNLKNPPFRNTMAIFENTWVAVRFQATNPGQWILHCHYEQHADQGLATVLKVNWPKTPIASGPPPLGAPPKDYPTC